jgi:excisionase family DNA binding protein
MPILDEYVDVVEAAGILNVHWETVKRLCREGRIPSQKVHNKWLIHKDDLRKFADAYDPRRGNKGHELG